MVYFEGQVQNEGGILAQLKTCDWGLLQVDLLRQGNKGLVVIFRELERGSERRKYLLKPCISNF